MGVSLASHFPVLDYSHVLNKLQLSPAYWSTLSIFHGCKYYSFRGWEETCFPLYLIPSSSNWEPSYYFLKILTNKLVFQVQLKWSNAAHPGGSLTLVSFPVAPGQSLYFSLISQLKSDSFALLCCLSDPSQYPKCSAGAQLRLLCSTFLKHELSWAHSMPLTADTPFTLHLLKLAMT